LELRCKFLFGTSDQSNGLRRVADSLFDNTPAFLDISHNLLLALSGVKYLLQSRSP